MPVTFHQFKILLFYILIVVIEFIDIINSEMIILDSSYDTECTKVVPSIFKNMSTNQRY